MDSENFMFETFENFTEFIKFKFVEHAPKMNV